MLIYDLCDVIRNLLFLIDDVICFGELFVIENYGKLLVKVVLIVLVLMFVLVLWVGFMKGQIWVFEDFDVLYVDMI